MRCLFAISLLLIVCPPGQAEMLQYQGRDGRRYFSNLPGPTQQGQQRRARPEAEQPDTTSQRTRLLGMINTIARRYDIAPRLVRAIVRIESNFNPRAVSYAGAQGLMQLMPATAKHYQVEDPFNPRANITGGIRYLKDLFRRFPGDVRRVLAAYHAGERAVLRYGGVPPFPETQQYVKQVMALYGEAPPGRKIYRYQTANGSILFTDTPR